MLLYTKKKGLLYMLKFQKKLSIISILLLTYINICTRLNNLAMTNTNVFPKHVNYAIPLHDENKTDTNFKLTK